jgi:hypothetical protein
MKIAIRTTTADEHERAIEYIRNVLGYDGRDDEYKFSYKFNYTVLDERRFTQTNNKDGYEIHQLPEELTFPRMMYVSNNNITYTESTYLILGIFKGRYVEGDSNGNPSMFFKYVKDAPQQVKVTLQEIADWKGCNVEQIKIV